MTIKGWKTICVKEETLKLLKEMKHNKGFNSLNELVHECAKVCKYYDKWQILKLASMEIQSSTQEDFDKRFSKDVGEASKDMFEGKKVEE